MNVFWGWINQASPLFLPHPLLPSLQCFYLQWLNRWIRRSTAPQKTRGSLCPITSEKKKKCKKQESRVYLSVKSHSDVPGQLPPLMYRCILKPPSLFPSVRYRLQSCLKAAISPHKCFSLIACFVYGSTHCLARRAQMSSAPSPDWERLLKIDALDTHNKEHLSADRLASLNCTSTNAFSALRPFRESNNLWGCKYAFWCGTYWKDQMIFACRAQWKTCTQWRDTKWFQYLQDVFCWEI